ncbi:hypothetical protein SNEBB_003575 [Seison nebaliae]|nr:hypothetical protein SNEBB_003575 [Seison nebaliae]
MSLIRHSTSPNSVLDEDSNSTSKKSFFRIRNYSNSVEKKIKNFIFYKSSKSTSHSIREEFEDDDTIDESIEADANKIFRCSHFLNDENNIVVMLKKRIMSLENEWKHQRIQMEEKNKLFENNSKMFDEFLEKLTANIELIDIENLILSNSSTSRLINSTKNLIKEVKLESFPKLNNEKFDEANIIIDPFHFPKIFDSNSISKYLHTMRKSLHLKDLVSNNNLRSLKEQNEELEKTLKIKNEEINFLRLSLRKELSKRSNGQLREEDKQIENFQQKDSLSSTPIDVSSRKTYLIYGDFETSLFDHFPMKDEGDCEEKLSRSYAGPSLKHNSIDIRRPSASFTSWELMKHS